MFVEFVRVFLDGLLHPTDLAINFAEPLVGVLLHVVPEVRHGECHPGGDRGALRGGVRRGSGLLQGW